MALDLESIQKESPAVVSASVQLEPLAGAGVNLTRWVLVILCVVMALLISAAFYQEKQFSDLLAASLRSETASLQVPGHPDKSANAVQAQRETLKAYQDVVEASREFWIKLGQMILLNLLLPVLTALLGYVFASKPATR